MTPPFSPTLFATLSRVQRTTSVGLHRTIRAAGTSERSAYRMQARLGPKLHIIPNVAVEALGLAHAHLFITAPTDAALTCKYAVESAMVTPDFHRDTLYLHCLVPLDQREIFGASAQSFGTRVRVVWSTSGWQQFLLAREPIHVPLIVTPEPSDLIRRCPFVIPSLMELWEYPNSLPVAWTRIVRRLGPRLYEYVPRSRLRPHNGRTHLGDAFHALQQDKLVLQQLIRYHPLLAASVEVFLVLQMSAEDIRELLEGLRVCLHATEVYPTMDGAFCRLLGPHRLLDAIIHLPTEVRERCHALYVHAKRTNNPAVRFAYETHFDAKTKTWRTS